MKTSDSSNGKNESRAIAQRPALQSKGAVAFAPPRMEAMAFAEIAPEIPGTKEIVQMFPHQVNHNDTATSFIARLDGDHIRLFNRAQEEVAYLQIQVTAHDWGMKNIYVHGDNLQGMGVGSLLVYFAADLAQRSGMGQLTVLTPSGAGLWANCGFTVTPRQKGPPDIAGTPTQVLNVTRPIVQGAFTISAYPAAAPAREVGTKKGEKDPRANEGALYGKGGMFEL